MAGQPRVERKCVDTASSISLKKAKDGKDLNARVMDNQIVEPLGGIEVVDPSKYLTNLQENIENAN